LQCNIGHDADHRDNRHQPGQQVTLAIARSDEIGNRGNAMRLADPDHFQDDAGKQQHQGRPEIDGKKGQAA